MRVNSASMINDGDTCYLLHDNKMTETNAIEKESIEMTEQCTVLDHNHIAATHTNLQRF